VRSGPGVVGLPVNVNGLQVRLGDIVVGDADAAVVAPLQRAEAVLTGAGEGAGPMRRWPASACTHCRWMPEK